MRSLLFPSRCAGCRGAALEEPEAGPLCADCQAQLPWLPPPWCARCGLALAGAGAGPCVSCRRHPPSFDGAVSVWRYEGVAQELVQALKYRGMLSLAPFLAREMAQAVRGRLAGGAAADAASRAAAVTAVPLHPTRLRERTFNQADALARRLAEHLGLPYRPELLRRRLPTQAQPGLSRQDRFRNVRDAFHAEARGLAAPAHLLLVDDVLTTGATAEACSLALKRAGAARVTVVTLARG